MPASGECAPWPPQAATVTRTNHRFITVHRTRSRALGSRHLTVNQGEFTARLSAVTRALLVLLAACGSAPHPKPAPAERVLGERATYRASFAAMGKLVKNAWDRGITIVAGTGYFVGMTLTRELELYTQIGIPAPDVLAMATLGAPRVMHLDKDRGSITPGKRADLVLVDGDPTQDIAQIRNARVVVCRGVVFDPAELWQASGMRPRP
jgi:imidazolonepropionase-like amidohydrolase